MLNFRDCLLSRREACYCSLQSVGESCLAQARTLRLDYQSPFCSRPSCGRNLRSRLVSFERPSNPRHLFHDRSTLQNLPNHRDWSYTLHLSFRQTCKLQRSSYRHYSGLKKRKKQNKTKRITRKQRDIFQLLFMIVYTYSSGRMVRMNFQRFSSEPPLSFSPSPEIA